MVTPHVAVGRVFDTAFFSLVHTAPSHRWFLPILAGAVLGPAFQVQQADLWSDAAYLAMGGLAAVAGLVGAIARSRYGARFSWFVLALTSVSCLGFAACGLRAHAFAAGALAPQLEGRDVRLTGVVAAMPQRSETGLRFRLRVEAATLDGQAVRVPRLMSLGWYSGPGAGTDGWELQRTAPELRAGERWALTARLRAPHGHINPHGFDYELWLWEQGIQATGYVRAGPRDDPPHRIEDTWRHPVERARQAVRDAIFARIADRAAAGVVAALVTGDQNAIERSDWDVFRATGVAHLMSISGLHVTMFAWLAAVLVGLAWRRSARLCLAWPAPHAASLGGLVLAAGYALFSGWGVPAQRTLLMLAAVAWLRLSGRRWPWPATWLFACALVVTADPWALMQPGFWLSFVAVGALFATDPGGTSAAGWRSRAAALLREQGVVTLALSPLTLLLFGQVSVVGLVANLVAIPWVTLVVTPLAMAGVALPLLWDGAAWAVQGLAWGLQALAALPWAVWSGAAPPVWAGAAGVLGGLLLAMRLPVPWRSLGIPLLLPAVLWQPPRPPAGEFELLAADIGQGNAVIVRTAGHTLVYDAGPRYSPETDAGQRVLVPLLRALDERVDLLVLSHRDTDHTGGAAALLAAHPGAALAGSLEEGHPLRSVRAPSQCLAGQHWRWDGVDFRFLHPTGAQLAAGRPNAASCVLRIDNGRQAALLAGDIEQPQEAALLSRGAPLAAQVLLVPHHGSKTSSSGAFLDAVQPRWALVQAGWRNRFGHPAAPVVDRYRERHAAVIESGRCGAAWWSSADPGRVRCEREAARRYWHHRPPPDLP
jgi:competence protein ComEC